MVADLIALRTGHDALGLPWLMMPVLILGGMILVFFVHPDPKEIGMHLERSYPGYTPPPKYAGQGGGVQLLESAPLSRRRGSRSFRTALGRAT